MVLKIFNLSIFSLKKEKEQLEQAMDPKDLQSKIFNTASSFKCKSIVRMNLQSFS